MGTFSRNPSYFISTLKRIATFLFLPVFGCGILLTPVYGQKNLAGEAEIRQRLDRLDTLGSVMMIAAHPDDENTALLAYFSRGRHVRTAYLSLTRGEGGQNLLGSEQGAALGVIRTRELIAARKIDGAEQFFTRAIDFGFSKTAADTFAHWPREEVLGDIVWDIRRFRPDVIILRFSGTPRDGHGQHQVSAILGREAFSAAADPSRYTEQFKLGVQPWQAKRLMYNVIAFTAEQEKEAGKMADRIVIDVGQYNPELGFSYAEIAGMSRSQHRSQGMGAPEFKGSQKQYLVTIAGDKATHDVFDGIDITWNRLAGGSAVEELVQDARKSLAPAHPEQTLKPLTEARPLIAAISDPVAKEKLKELDETIADCAGLWLDAASDRYWVAPGGVFKVNATALLREPVEAGLLGLSFSGMESAPSPDIAAAVLENNQPSRYAIAVQVPEVEAYSQPYWLVQPPDGWLYTVPDPRMIGDPENPPVLDAHFRMKVAGTAIDYDRPVEFHYIDHIYGELTRPLAIVPPLGIDMPRDALVWGNTNSRRVEIPLRANTSKMAGDIRVEAPDGWRMEPAPQHFDLASGQQVSAIFDVTPPPSDSQTELRATASAGDRPVDVGTQVIAYPHIPVQTLFPPAETRLVRADIKILAHNIGYVMGAGDEEPDAIRQMGCAVTLLSSGDLATGDLSRFDAIVTGVRAWNVRADLRASAQRLFDYVQNGGALTVQYNVLEGGPLGGDPSLLERIGPYPITISRDRVTDPKAPVAFPNPQNPLLHVPNEITEKDFEGWVQERGLNFASEWDPKYESVLESHDPGEEPHAGGELYTRYGKGIYIFTAYSWFRELPAGVAGAYRLFANMMSAAKIQR